MTAPPQPPVSDAGSTLRLLAGTVLIILGLVLAVTGFLRLTSVLESGGYGTSAMRMAFFILGGAGAAFSTGIATIIWDIAKRYEHR